MHCKICGKQSVEPWSDRPSELCYECERNEKVQVQTAMIDNGIRPGSSASATQESKSVGYLLGAAIFIMPYLFSWVTLKNGYSNMVRVLSFSWMALFIMAIVSPSGDNASTEVVRGDFSDQQICKAAISTIMGRLPSIIRIASSSGGVTYLSYIADGTKWDYRCRIQGNNAVWAAEPGRWRTEDDIQYSVSGTRLVVSELYSDGSSNRKVYEISQL